LKNTEFLCVKNFEKYQHYAHRKPPWIKLYYAFLSSPNVAGLSDACRYHVIAIMLLASQHDNKLPFNKSWISRVIQANSRINWDEIFDSDIIECYQDASTLQANPLCRVEYIKKSRVYKEEADTPISPKGELCETGKRCNGEFKKCHDNFELFWDKYPKHQPGKSEVRKCWCKCKNDFASIMVWLDRAIPLWDDPQFIPYASTFLNKRRWEGDAPLPHSIHTKNPETLFDQLRREAEEEEKNGKQVSN
jgi:hypothetical protein